jgi:hypothetical protein
VVNNKFLVSFVHSVLRRMIGPQEPSSAPERIPPLTLLPVDESVRRINYGVDDGVEE